MGDHYIIVVYELESIRHVLRLVKRHGKIEAIVVLASMDKPQALGGIKGGLKKITRKIVIIKGYLPLPIA